MGQRTVELVVRSDCALASDSSLNMWELSLAAVVLFSAYSSNACCVSWESIEDGLGAFLPRDPRSESTAVSLSLAGLGRRGSTSFTAGLSSSCVMHMHVWGLAAAEVVVCGSGVAFPKVNGGITVRLTPIFAEFGRDNLRLHIITIPFTLGRSRARCGRRLPPNQSN